ncbi:amidohydrolase [Epilithonimonas arachidiradicis]|uniref:Omega-amidase YafV n=1 Tax=Epilithonimonas arachidiradicis TaxID=1617282 RepID=A0A420DD45_9FLAO|nr:amidohydrolase [Epilithonimonas arachidiradicis]RKE89820.1 putative amidohydrolase [Epilithonimonas arachidiradicis]GGG45562.1 amidohydrolase [Epilithonimonas arachidiradicis]
MSTLKIAGLNLDIAWKNKEENFRQIENEFATTEADLFLLPEMFSTGFCMEADEVADRNEESLMWMKSFAKDKNSAVAGSVSVEENGKFYNRFYFVFPNGNYEYYDKRHLFSYSGEDKIYTAGTERKIIDYKGFKILLQVCFDLRFPVFSRNQNDYDAVLYVANWPKSRVEAWKSLLKARSIENQAFLFGLNRIGTDGYNLEYEESSLVYFPDGREISERKNNLIITEWNLDELKDFRSKFPFLNERDEFQLNSN